MLVLKVHKGLVYRQGKFSEIEESQLRNAIENYRIVSDLRFRGVSVTNVGTKRNELTPDQLSEVIFAKEKTKDKEFWQEISASSQHVVSFLLHGGAATAVPLRPIVAVYHHVRRGYHPLRGQGKWSTEQDTLLEQ